MSTFDKTKESDRFRQEYEIRRMNQASINKEVFEYVCVVVRAQLYSPSFSLITSMSLAFDLNDSVSFLLSRFRSLFGIFL